MTGRISEELNIVIKKFVNTVTKFLNNDQPHDALEYFEKYGSEEILTNSASELVPLIATYLNRENSISCKNLFEVCEKILVIFAKTCDSSEMVLLLCEQAETFEDDIRFISLLDPLIVSLRRDNSLQSIDFFTISTRAYIEDLPQPDNDNNEDNDNYESIVERLTTTHKLIISKIEQLTLDISKDSDVQPKVFYNMLNLHINLFGAPFSHLHVETGEKEESSFHSGVRQILALECDPIRFLKFVQSRFNEFKANKNHTDDKDSDDSSDLEKRYLDLEVEDEAYGNFFFTLMTSNTLRGKLPQIYHPLFILSHCSCITVYLLQQAEYVLISKGIQLAASLIQNVEKESIHNGLIESNKYTGILFWLSYIMIHCNSIKERKHALQVFQDYFYLFTMRARHLLIRSYYEKKKHSGLRALVVNIMKTSIIESMDDPLRNDAFSGIKLKSILTIICKIPQGENSNIIEISDEIIGVLNLLRFLLIRDKMNVTGIWELIGDLEDIYLKPLRKEIDRTRHYWKFQIKDFELQLREGIESKDLASDSLTVSIGSVDLPDIPVTEKIKICNQALIALDVIESLLIRVHECIRGLWTSRVLLLNDTHKSDEKSSESTKDEPEEEYEKQVKSKILSASLPFVPELGWSQQAISAGAESIGYPGVIHGLFPSGGVELVQHFYSSCNAELNKILKVEALAIEQDPSKPKKAPEIYVKDALEARLRMLVPYKSTWPQAMGLMTLPPNVPTALANLLTLVDDICYYAGDRSVDFNWYTRRIVLAGIYKTTELYLLQDNSIDNKATWKFLERRIEDAVQLHRVLNVSDLPSQDRALNRATETATAAFTTARNILGLNWNR